YGVEEQSRVQLLSVILAVAGLAHADDPGEFARTMSEDFELNDRLGSVFHRLLPCVVIANILVIGLTVSVFYALWRRNIFGRQAPYAIQMCSLASWASGAIGLMMLGGNPRVTISSSKPAPKHVQDRLELVTGNFVPVSFGSLHGSVYVEDRGTCYIPVDVLRSAVQGNDADKASWNNLGIVLRAKAEFGEALFCFRKALSLDGQFALARQNLEQLEQEVRDSGGSWESAQPAELAPTSEDATSTPWMSEWRDVLDTAHKGNFEEALGAADRLLLKWENAPLLVVEVARLYQSSGDGQTAVHMLNTAI
ncbi:MAG: hypothetical protein M1823_006574, partial [Watsoniomyces obsoletus]